MKFKTDFNRMIELSRKLKHFEAEIESLIFKILKETKSLTKNVNQSSNPYEIKRICESILSSVEKTNSLTIDVTQKINRQQKEILKGVESYKAADKFESIN